MYYNFICNLNSILYVLPMYNYCSHYIKCVFAQC